MEVNFLANIQMMVEIAKSEGKISEEVASDILKQVKLGDGYLSAWREDNSLLWHEYRDSVDSKE